MRLTENMVNLLSEIRRIETEEHLIELDRPEGELGNRLIDLYYATDNLQTRELITQFLKSAGFVWLRKLVTRDTSPAAAPDGVFASIQDFLGILPSGPANDANGNELKSG